MKNDGPPATSVSRSRLIGGWALVALALILITLAGWIRFHFGAVTFEQVLNNLPTGGNRTVGNRDLAIQALLICLIAPLVVVIATVATIRHFKVPVLTHRRARVIPSAAFALGLAVLLSVAGVPEYAVAQFNTRTIAPYYATPQIVSSPAKPMNLITIYLESTENTFGDSELMGQNLLVNLDSSTKGWVDYQGMEQYDGGGWTMAGLVSTQCGIPLKNKSLVGSISLNDFGEHVEQYLPGATCLGDVLKQQGYTSVFVGGADGDFAGKDTYLTNHGYTKVYGLADWKADGESSSNISQWGLSDARMLKHATDVVDALHEAEKPFNLTMLTLDTHEPAAVYPSCHTSDDVAMETAIKCSTSAVGKFLTHLKSEGYLKDTVVMVMGDHLKGTSDADAFHSILSAAPGRTVVFRTWSPSRSTFNRSSADQLSVLPTALELMGFGIPGGRAGVGVSLVGKHDLSGTALALPQDEYYAVLRAPSTAIYEDFWRPR